MLFGIRREVLLPFGTFVWISQFGIRLFGYLSENGGVALLRFGRRKRVGILHDVSVGPAVARAVDDTLILG